MSNNNTWNHAKSALVSSLIDLGYPAELGDIIVEHIGSPSGIEQMVSYLNCVKPDKVELIVDEMLAIKSEIDRWREKKAFENANSKYNLVLNNGLDSADG